MRAHVSYQNANAGAAPHTPILVNGVQHPTHVFMFSRVFDHKDLKDICSRLNLTDYQVAVCCVDKSQVSRGAFALSNTVELKTRVVTVISGGGESYGCRVFVRVAPPPRWLRSQSRAAVAKP